MSTSITQPRSRPKRPSPALPAPGPDRRPFRDNPRLILAGILLLLVSLAAIVRLSDRTTRLNPNFLSEAVLYTLSVADVTMLLGLGFVLARNVIKLVVERRRGLPFARFRLKLVAALLGLTIVPSVLVLLAGTEMIRQTTARWFSQPVTDVLTSANAIAGTFYRDREAAVAAQAKTLMASIPPDALSGGDVEALKRAVSGPVTEGHVGMVEIYRLQTTGARPDVAPVMALQSPSLPPGHLRASSDRLAAKIAAGSSDTQAHEPLEGGGELVRAGVVIRDAAGRPAGVVIASDFLSGDLAQAARRITEAYEDYSQLRVLKGPLEGVYLSLFVMMTLMILVSATWLGFYLAKRITRPVGILAAGAREIGAGHLDHRIEPDAHDEFGALVEAFNTMAGELASSQQRLDRSRVDLERKSLEADARRRYLETILERIATGVVCFDAHGRVSVVNPVARRLLALDADALGKPAAAVFGRDDLRPLAGYAATPSPAPAAAVTVAAGTGGGGVAVAAPPDTAAQQEVTLVRDGHERHLLVASTTLGGDGGALESVLVVDDVTPLVRAQKVAAWRDVARRLAHEIKNPLTPIQLSAERLKRHFADAPDPTRRLVDECARAIVAEVESLKSLVDEFSQFARMPAPKAVPTDLNALLADALALYAGLLTHATVELDAGRDLPPVRLDPEQVRRVVINLVDNAIEALNEARETGRLAADTMGRITLDTAYDPGHGVVRLRVADNGPGLPAGDRSKLFMPYYSTKGRGSGLGLAIVRRIIAEHGGSIEAGDNTPQGTCFTIELPV